MPTSFTHLPYSDTGSFSHLVTDYLNNSINLQDFYEYAPNKEGMLAAIEKRSKYPVDRKVLVATLSKQYEQLPKHEKVEQNLQLLAAENTYTICTAHQPNLLTGYLYFIYKILHAIKLAEELKALLPDKNFVPVYYMGSEDNDLDELGTFRYNGDKYVWKANGQSGAVGRMNTEGLKPLFGELFKLFGPPGEHLDRLKDMITKAYLQHETIGQATQYLVNELFGQYGLIILDPDEAAFKRCIIHIMKDDLLHETAYSIVSEQIEKLSVHYKAQAHPRPINLFYLNDQLRERIERKDGHWRVVNTEIIWTEEELMQEMEAHPERFSPNVILRGLLQESILPDVAFIGGGAEVAYWLQLKSLFAHYHVFYPAILLRQSVLWVEPAAAKLRDGLKLSVQDIFKPEVVLVREYVTANSNDDWQTANETTEIEKILNSLKQKASSLDPTLRSSAEAVTTKIKHQLEVLEKKMLRAEKRKMHTQLQKISRLKATLFPNNSLQERVENFSTYYLLHGNSFLDTLKDAMQPFRSEFLVVEQAAD
ncbi:MAG: bacillithiol biosynthesis cysteine-adding enzyme BshC [Flavipsychrobacter sp.]